MENKECAADSPALASEQQARLALEAREAEKKRGRKRVGAGFLYFGVYWGAQLLVQVPAGIVLAVRAVLSMNFQEPDYAQLFAMLQESIKHSAVLLTVITNLVFFAAIFILFKARKCSFLREIGAAPAKLSALWPLVPLGIALNFFVSGALSFLPESWLASYEGASGMLLGGTDALTVFTVVVLSPAAEETLFRGLLYGRFRDDMRRGWAMVLSSALFGILHGHPLWMLYAFLLGMLFACVYERYGSVWASFLAHLAFNGASYLIMLFIPNASAGILLIFGGLLSAALLWYVFRIAEPKNG